MNSNWNKLEGNHGELIVEINGEEWTKACDKALKKLAGQVKLDGFRPGKAPKSMVKKMLRKEAIYDEAIQVALPNDKFFELLVENKLEPITQPQMNVVEIDETHAKLQILIEVQPEVELKQYKDFDVKKEEVVVTDEDVNTRIENLRKANAEWVIKEDGTVENGDTAVIDYKGYLGDEPFEGGEGENHPLEIGSGSFIPGFEEQIIGMKANETKDITVTFPENYGAEDLAGKEAKFTVTVHEIKQKELPELDEDFVADCEIEGVTTMEQLTEYERKQITDEKTQKVENDYDEAIFKAVIDANPVDVPDAMVDQEVQNMVSEVSQNLQQQGIDFETYKQITGQTTEQIKEGLRNQAVDRVHFNLIIQAVIAAENITVTDEDVEAEYAKMVPQYGETVEDVKKQMQPYESYLRSDIAHQKAVDVIKGE